MKMGALTYTAAEVKKAKFTKRNLIKLDIFFTEGD